jgi:hypothetical protein
MGLGWSSVLRSLPRLRKKEDGCCWEESGQTRESTQEEEGGNYEGHCAIRKSYYSAGKNCCAVGKRWPEVTVRRGGGFSLTSLVD